MKTLCRAVAGLVLPLILLLTGCEAVNAPPPASAFFIARLQDCKTGVPIPQSDNFAPGEVPAAVFVNYHGQTVTVRVHNVNSGAISWNKTEYIPQDRTTGWWSLQALPGGAYKAEMLVGGIMVQSYNFSIAKAPARRR